MSSSAKLIKFKEQISTNIIIAIWNIIKHFDQAKSELCGIKRQMNHNHLLLNADSQVLSDVVTTASQFTKASNITGQTGLQDISGV